MGETFGDHFYSGAAAGAWRDDPAWVLFRRARFWEVMMTSEPVELAAAIRALRQQLGQARQDGWFEELGFVLEPVELTVQAVVEREANGKIGWSVLGLGAEYQSTATQTIKLTLTPVRRNPDGSVTRNFTIADQQQVEPVFGEAPGPR